VTKATLNDELMREAGFETDYSMEHARRHEQSRQRLRRAMRFVAVAGSFVWLIAETIAWMGADVPRALLGLALAVGFVGGVADWLLGRMTRDEDDHPRRGIRWLRKRVARQRRLEDQP
jgi:hypothetical protein